MTPACDAGKSAVAAVHTCSRHHDHAACERCVEQRAEQPIGRTANAQVDDLRMPVERGLKRPGQRQRVAHGDTGRALAAAAQYQQPRRRRHADNAHAVAGPRDDDAGDGGAMPFSRIRVLRHRVLHRIELTAQIRMFDLDAAVDLRNEHATPGGESVQAMQLPGARGRLQTVERIAVGTAAEHMHRLGPGGALVSRDAPPGHPAARPRAATASHSTRRRWPALASATPLAGHARARSRAPCAGARPALRARRNRRRSRRPAGSAPAPCGPSPGSAPPATWLRRRAGPRRQPPGALPRRRRWRPGDSSSRRAQRSRMRIGQ